MQSPPTCQVCGFTVYNRRYPKCESCGAELGAGLALSRSERNAVFEEERRVADAQWRLRQKQDGRSDGGGGDAGGGIGDSSGASDCGAGGGGGGDC